MTSADDIKKPFNPNYIVGIYAVYLFIVASFLLTSSPEIIHSIYLFLKSLGAEDFITSISRPSRIRAFLLERGDVVRWESIMSYFTFMLLGLFIAIPTALYYNEHYIRWYIPQPNSTWDKPVDAKIRKTVNLFGAFALFYNILMPWSFIIGSSVKENTYSRGMSGDDIHLHNTAYFSLILSSSLLIIFFLSLHSITKRFWHDRRLNTQLSKQKGESL